MHVCLTIVMGMLFLSQSATPPQTHSGATGAPEYAMDGRIALTWNGNIWIVTPTESQDDGTWLQITKGPSEDRDPTWTADGEAIVFSSNRGGTFNLWRIDIGPNGAMGEAVGVTQSDQDDTSPDISGDGTLVWVRGRGPDADLWYKSGDGPETRLTTRSGAELTPAVTSDGSMVAYISEQKRRKQLRLVRIVDRSDTLVIGDMPAEYPAWSPDGQRITFSTRGIRTGIWVTPPTGRYRNLVSSMRATSAWSPDGQQIALVALPRNEPTYNGDPQSTAPRTYDSPMTAPRTLTFVSAPPPPDDGRMTITDASREIEGDALLERFDRVATYLTSRYRLNRPETKDAWVQVSDKYRAAAASAKNETDLDRAIFGLLKDRPALRQEVSGKAVVSSAHPAATAAGLEILKKGGNVVDAAVAVSFALGVVEPDASGPGGYGEMLIYLKGMDAPICIEFLTRVPEAASLSNGQLRSLPQNGPVLVNVPGTVAGMELAWKRYGSDEVSWEQLVAPSVTLAEDGFVLDDAFTTTLAREQERYLQYESTRALFFPDGRPLAPGDTLRNPDFAWTLKHIAEKGAKAFYEGEIAKRMVTDLRSRGNVMTMEDMARYYAVERTPVTTTYRDHTVYSGPPPVSGGASLAGKLNLLEQFGSPKRYRDHAPTLHSMIEAWKLAPSTRGRIADPGLWPVNLDPFTDKRSAEEHWDSCFNPNHSLSPADSSCLNKQIAWGADNVLDARTSTGTTAYVVMDSEGNMVSVTQTLGTWGGNFYVTPGLGFIYNDKLRSYGSNPRGYNARIPFARNVTSISPTLVFKGKGEKQKPYLAVGAAGNAWITSAVYQIVAGVIDQKLTPQEAIEQPRFLVGIRREPGNRDVIREIVVQVEDGFAPGVLQKLRAMGHDFQPISARGELRMGYASAAIVDDGKAHAGADPRRSGEAGALP